MPGIGDPGQPAIAQVNPASLVTPASPVVTPDAVRALTDAFRQGQITAGDIIDRVGVLGQAKRKAELHIAQSQGSPEADAARQAQLVAAKNQAVLAGTQAGAQTPLVQPATQLASGDLQQKLSEFGTGMPTDMVRQLNMVYGLGAQFDPQTGVLTNPDQIKQSFQGILGAQNGWKLAQDLQSRVETKVVDSPDGSGRKVEIPTWKGTGKALTDEQREVLNHYNSMMPRIMSGKTPLVTPLSAPAPGAAPVVTPAGGGTPGVNEPKQGGLTDESGNLVVSQGNTPDAAAKISSQLEGQDSYKEWEKAAGFYDIAKKEADKINSMPPSQQRAVGASLNQNDIALAEATIKLFDPQGVLREFKWDKMEQHQPWPAQLKNILATAVDKQALTPETRQQLMEVATTAIQSRENQLVGVSQRAKTRAGQAGITDLNQVMTPEQQKFASGNLTPDYQNPWAKDKLGNLTDQRVSAAPAAAQTGSAAPMKRQTPDGRVMVSADGGKTWNWVQ